MGPRSVVDGSLTGWTPAIVKTTPTVGDVSVPAQTKEAPARLSSDDLSRLVEERAMRPPLELVPPPARPAEPRPSSARRWLPPRLENESTAPEAVRRRDRVYRHLLAGGDLMATALALLICIPILGHGDSIAPGALLGPPLVVLAAKLLGLYDRDELLLRKTTLDEAPALFQLATLGALLVWLTQGLSVTADMFGRDQVLGLWLTLFVLLVLFRAAARRFARVLETPERCLLAGAPEACDRARAKLQASEGVHAEVVAQVDFEAAENANDAAAVLGTMARERDVHRVVVAPPSTDHGEVLNLIRAAKALGLKVSVLPRMLEVVGSSVEFDDVDGLGVLGVRRFGLSRSSFLVKRAMDVGGSSLLLLLFSPVFLLCAVAIKLNSRGPVFFRQQRVGRDGRLFEMRKFRTMVVGAEARKAELEAHNEADGLFKIADDPRVTRVGRVLRRTSLDELPQLLNVLRGDMSLVGPRPLVPEDDRRVEGWYRRRLHLTPGMTGRWQVLGSARIPLHEMVKLDYLYVANWSLWGDVKILLRTLPFVLGRRGL
jgi:exopolysaccharide biosynthesis polyprenyl glycosylphosphotransferase